MLAAVRSATLLGVQGITTTVEVHHTDAVLPGFSLVGLPDEACRESRDRVRAAVLSTGLKWPTAAKFTVNLAPSGRRKGGSGLDLAIALGVLAVTGQLGEHFAQQFAELGVIGELGLDGSVRGVPGVAPMVASMGTCRPLVPAASVREAMAIAGTSIYAVSTLAEVVAALLGTAPWPDVPMPTDGPDVAEPPDLADVRGQPVARHALEVSAAGAHHLLLVGPPGSGKTMLAQRMAGLLPPLDRVTATEATMIHSAVGASLPTTGLVTRPPFCAPHHTASQIGLIGGGSNLLRPGLISLSHGGVLFMDELGEFPSTVLDAMRQPLESGVITVSRAQVHADLPARFLLVGATNPCPCGGGAPGACECDETARGKYLRRLSGPFLDRFDLRVAVLRPAVDDLLAPGDGEPTAVVAARVAAAQAMAIARQGRLNAYVRGADLDRAMPISRRARDVLRAELESNRLTGRGMHRVRRVARTVADVAAVADRALDPERPVDEVHVALAMSMRIRIDPQRAAA